ncbi:MAG: APC family permease [Desulfobacteraceae bacterium]|jgi:APA family basic amino acid/polyamine antiporter|nr:APC family permease [Desulfobacteraceae bacterium]
MSEGRLKRVLGLAETTAVAVGFTIGGGVFVFTGIVFKIVGAALPLAYALALLPIFAAVLPVAMLGAALPTTGGSYRYPSRMVSPALAFVGIWVYALACFFGQIPLYALGCARYLQALIPGLKPVPAAAAIVTFFYLINLFGVRLAARVQGLLVAVLVSALLYYTAAGISVFQPRHFSGFFDHGLGPLLLGSGLLTFTYLGANGIVELGGEIVDPGRVIPRAMFIALAMVAVVYIAVALVTVGALPEPELAEAAEPLVRVMESTAGRWGFVFFICGGAILALTTTLNALFIVGTKSLLVVAGDRLLPPSLGRLHPRFGTPVVLLTGVWALSILGIVSGLSLQTLAAYASLGGMIIFLPMQIAALRLAKRFPARYAASGFRLRGIWLRVCPVAGIGLILFFTAVILVDLATPLKVGGFGLFLISGITYYALRRRQLERQGFSLAGHIARDPDLDGTQGPP